MDYLESMGLFLMMIGVIHGGISCPAPASFQDGSFFKEMAKVLASVQLHGSPQILAMVRELVRKVNSCMLSQAANADDIQELDEKLQIIANTMKSELAQVNIE